MTQRFSLWEDLSARENLTFMARIHSLRGATALERIATAVEEFRLAEFIDRPAGTLSGGQKQRLALAAVTLHRPALLLLDEPTSAVDPQSRRDFWESLFRLTGRGSTILVSTHYMDEAERCHELAILHLGRVVAQGAPRELMASLPYQVLEVQSSALEAARQVLDALPGICSIAQLGLSLHVLVIPGQRDADSLVRQALVARGIAAEVRRAEANLEDVFVAATLASDRAA